MLKIYTILFGIILAPIAIIYTTETRGYNAIGGEYLLIPLFLLIAQVVKETTLTAIYTHSIMELAKTVEGGG
ncbi:MAG: hypothetical protein DDT29_00713 [Dehalococcoidia bacterium]|nr:hypothetical protein [Bacillota bacterium]